MGSLSFSSETGKKFLPQSAQRSQSRGGFQTAPRFFCVLCTAIRYSFAACANLPATFNIRRNTSSPRRSRRFWIKFLVLNFVFFASFVGNLWLSAELLFGPIRYPRSSILDPRSLFWLRLRRAAFFVVDHRFLLSGLCVRSMVRGLLHQAGLLGDLLHRLVLFTHLGDEFFRRSIVLDHAERSQLGDDAGLFHCLFDGRN